MVQTTSKRLRLLVIEQEEIYKYMYECIPSRSPIDLIGVSDYSGPAMLKQAISTCQPDVLIIGTKKLENEIMEGISQIREDYGEMAIIFLSKSYTDGHTEILRTVVAKGEGGVAIFLKQSLDQIEQLLAIIKTVSHGQVVLDPALAGVMLTCKKSGSSFLEQLTPRELEVLGLLATGYSNLAIAEAKYIDVKTVERHLNSMYSKLRTVDALDHKHPRVAATIRYLHDVKDCVA